jgi:hypothetical protein
LWTSHLQKLDGLTSRLSHPQMTEMSSSSVLGAPRIYQAQTENITSGAPGIAQALLATASDLAAANPAAVLYGMPTCRRESVGKYT